MRAVVTGRVQGVGFRAYVAASASMDGVRGEVWNRRDGSVELIAWHDEPESLERFQDSLARGPGHADNVSAQPSEDAQGCAGFRVVVRG